MSSFSRLGLSYPFESLAPRPSRLASPSVPPQARNSPAAVAAPGRKHPLLRNTFLAFFFHHSPKFDDFSFNRGLLPAPLPPEDLPAYKKKFNPGPPDLGVRVEGPSARAIPPPVGTHRNTCFTTFFPFSFLPLSVAPLLKGFSSFCFFLPVLLLPSEFPEDHCLPP